jgi:hypothetical protein
VSKDDNFFQFPIGAIKFPKLKITEVSREAVVARLFALIGYCIVTEGRKLFESDRDDAEGAAERCSVEPVAGSDNELIVRAGSGLLNVRPGTLDWEHWYRHWSLIDDLCERGSTQHVRVRNDLIWNIIKDDPKQLTWRQFANLCAVYSVIGGHPMTCVSYDRLGAMALGYNGTKARDADKANKYQLTTRQTQCTIKQLEELKFFVSASPNGRHNFYSHRLSKDELIRALIERETHKTKAGPKAITALIREEIKKVGK